MNDAAHFDPEDIPDSDGDERTQELPNDVVEEIRQSSAQELEQFGYQRDDSKTLDIIDNVLNQVRDAVRSTGFQRPPNAESTDFRVAEESPENDDRIDIGTDHVQPPTGALEKSDPIDLQRLADSDYRGSDRERGAGKGSRRRTTSSFKRGTGTERRTSRHAAGEKTYYDLKFVTELARKHGIAEAKYDALARRMQEQERATGFERVEVSDTLFNILLDLQTIASHVDDVDPDAGDGLHQAIARVGHIQQRLNENSRAFREEHRLPSSVDLSSGARQALGVEAAVDASSSARRATTVGDSPSGLRSSAMLQLGESSRTLGEWSSPRPRWRRKWPNARIARWSVGIALPLVLMLWFIAASTFPVSRIAVVDAPLQAITTPILGQIIPTDSMRGDDVAKGQELATIRNDQVDTKRLDTLRARADDLLNRRQDLEQELLQTIAESQRLRDEQDAWRRDLIGRSEAELAEQEALLMQSESALVNQQQLLQQAQAASVAAAEKRAERADDEEGDEGEDPILLQRIFALERIVNAMELKRNAHQALRDRLEARYRSLLDGTYNMGESPPYVERIARLTDTQEDHEQRIQVLSADLLDHQDLIVEEEREVERLREATVVAHQAGVLWQRHAMDGDTVSPGTRVVSIADDRRCRVKAWMDRSTAATLRTGQMAYIHLLGPDEVIHGRVEVIGSQRSAVGVATQRVSTPPSGTVAIEVAAEDALRLRSTLGQGATVLVAEANQGVLGRLLLEFRMWLEF